VEFIGNRPQIDAKRRESDADPAAGSFAAFAASRATCKNFSWAGAKSILLCRSLSPSPPVWLNKVRAFNPWVRSISDRAENYRRDAHYFKRVDRRIMLQRQASGHFETESAGELACQKVDCGRRNKLSVAAKKGKTSEKRPRQTLDIHRRQF
jgi:hypothetical protein